MNAPVKGPIPLPREIAPGVFWIGGCLTQKFKGREYHGYNAAFIVVGSEASLLVETGHPKDFPSVEEHMNAVLSRPGVAPLKHIFITHQETPHSGGLGRILDIYPGLQIWGDVSDYHLAFPEHAHLLHFMKEGDSIDLGDRKFVAVEPVIRDLRTTWWGFDDKTRTLFPGDGFAYSHYHWDGHCGLVAEEATSLDLADVSAVFAERALYWTTMVDMNIYVDRMAELMKRLDVKVVAPTHGLPVTDLPTTFPKIRDGLLAGEGVYDTTVQDGTKAVIDEYAPRA
jgi:flavorubredoxin